MQSLPYIQFKKGMLLFAVAVAILSSCKKYPEGFLSPYFQYPISEYSIGKGRIFTSDAINPDGSSIPFKVKLVHIYNESGNIVDDIFLKTYPVSVWTSAYNNAVDTTAALVEAKRKSEELPPITINEKNGAIEANPGTLNLPSGRYTLDLEISNVTGTQLLKNIVTIVLEESPAYEGDPELGTALNVAIKSGSETTTISQPNPIETASRLADTPNIVEVKFVDKNGAPFNPHTFLRRPNAGLNPIPPVRPQLSDYLATANLTDSTIQYNYSVTPFPLQASAFGYGFRYYYRIPYQYVKIDNVPDDYSTNPSFVFRVWIPGKYEVTIQLPDAVKE